MYAHLLIAVDGSELSARAARHGMTLARALGAKVTILTVSVPWAAHFAREPAVLVPAAIVPQSEYEAGVEATAYRTLKAIADWARQEGVDCRTLHRWHVHPCDAITDAARQHGCDLIVLGAHGRRGVAGLLLGTETVRVLTHGTLPVLVYREPRP